MNAIRASPIHLVTVGVKITFCYGAVATTTMFLTSVSMNFCLASIPNVFAVCLGLWLALAQWAQGQHIKGQHT